MANARFHGSVDVCLELVVVNSQETAVLVTQHAHFVCRWVSCLLSLLSLLSLLGLCLSG